MALFQIKNSQFGVNMCDFLKELNEAQREAVTSTEGYYRIIAGAGSGKTRALVSRYAYLVLELGIHPSNIACITFTNKAANEMKKRIRGIIGDTDGCYISTFHGLCASILREDISFLHYPSNFIIADNEDIKDILSIVFEDMNINSRILTFKQAIQDISLRKGNAEYVDDIVDLSNKKIKEKIKNATTLESEIFYRYQYELKKSFALDFNDLMSYAIYIFNNSQEIKEKWQKRLNYVMVDEFQDLSHRQAAFSEIISSYHKNLFVVGDPDQTIYSWRGADVNLIMNFVDKHQGAKTIIIDRNYRSSPDILSVSNSLISKNVNRVEKDLIPVKTNKAEIPYFHGKTQKEEAQWISEQIMNLNQNGVSFSQVAILYRAHYVSRTIEETFIQNKIPYSLFSGVEFYGRKEIKDAISYLRMVLNCDDISFMRVINTPKRNFGKKRMSIIKEYAESNNCSFYSALMSNRTHDLIITSDAINFVNMIENLRAHYKDMTISDLFDTVMDESGLEEYYRLSGEQERLDNLSELKQSIYNYEHSAGEETSLESYLEQVALFTNLDKVDNKNTVKMMTIHTAKGLEFPYVFVCTLNEGIFPTKHTKDLESLEEERRLAYVAFTRAEDGLFISESEGVNYDGSFRYPSRFIFNIDEMLLKRIVEFDDKFIDECARFIKNQEDLIFRGEDKFEPYDTINHKVFGKGIITNVDNENSSYEIKFFETETFRKISFSIGEKVLTLLEKGNV